MLAAAKVKLIVPLWHRTLGIDKTESRRRELWTACVFDKDAEHRRTDLSRFAAGSWLTTPPPRSAPPILHACKHPGSLSPVSHSILSMGQSVIASPSMLRYRAANFDLPAHPGLFCWGVCPLLLSIIVSHSLFPLFLFLTHATTFFLRITTTFVNFQPTQPSRCFPKSLLSALPASPLPHTPLQLTRLRSLLHPPPLFLQPTRWLLPAALPPPRQLLPLLRPPQHQFTAFHQALPPLPPFRPPLWFLARFLLPSTTRRQAPASLSPFQCTTLHPAPSAPRLPLSLPS